MAAAIFSLLALVFVAPASASSSLQIGMDDDGLMQRALGTTEPTAALWKQQGVGQARLTLVWTRIAPGAESTKRPAGFDPRDPNSPGYVWGDVDRAVAALEANQIDVSILVAAPNPYWASRVPSRRSKTYKPDPKALGDFMFAIATRYKGRIKSYLPVNEPNLWQYITPQYSCRSKSAKSCTLSGAAIYRDLYRSGYAAVKAADPAASVWIGSLAPHGRPGVSPTASSPGPSAFFKAMACVKSNYAVDKRSPGCKSYKPLLTDGIAHHPHTVLLSPTQRYRGDGITTANISTLTKLFDRLQSKGRVRNSSVTGSAQKRKRLDVFLDEYGVQTNPPDKLQGLSLTKQDQYYQQVSYMMWKNPRVKLLAFYLWQDEPYTQAKSWAWQSGMYYANGKIKPSGRSFAHPFWVDLPKGSKRATIWGQVRAAQGDSAEQANGTSSKTVTVQVRSGRKGSFKKLKTLSTNAGGYFSFKASVAGTRSFRFVYGSPAQSSEVRTVKPRRK
ncbi:MAG: hypothetical protein NWS55_03070 [Solirubrobacteraceae bacterium]|nr:hypothetical protein [Solirubrobacteraceae bacterium]